MTFSWALGVMKVDELESSLHLYQPPLYRGAGGEWRKSIIEAVGDCDSKLTWDCAAMLGILGFTYTCGDRTLVNEVKRRPWLSSIGPDNEPLLEKIPSHGRLWEPTSQIAENLCNLLCNEALEVCSGKNEIYLLLSGGLDSRVVAGILARLYNGGELATKPICVTWGLENSRDVVYGRLVARILGFEWQHVDMSHEDIIYNIEEMSTAIGALVSPIHLHAIHWFKNVSKESLVLSGSYGDSVGRAEFSGRHLLELDYLRPVNPFGLIRNDVLELAYNGLKNDLKELRERTPGQPKYVYCEHEMQGHYMRNMISQAMSLTGQYCSIYQMFTHPNVYSYMWSLHPALRNDRIYGELLEKLNPQLARIPWARTNRALRGETVGAKSHLRKDFHQYKLWVSRLLLNELRRYFEPEWFAETGIFNPDKIKRLSKQAYVRGEILIILMWLAAFRRMAEYLESLGKSVKLDDVTIGNTRKLSCRASGMDWEFIKQLLRNSVFLYNLVNHWRKLFRSIRRFVVKRRAIREYPPVKVINEEK